ncbi:MAG: hypothetical protein WBN81_16520 [Gammaproteobacteria bacterium]
MMVLFLRPANLNRFNLSLGLLGITTAAAFLVWLLAGWLGWVPGMVDVFGVEGMRTPAAISVAALLLAALSFWEC